MRDTSQLRATTNGHASGYGGEVLDRSDERGALQTIAQCISRLAYGYVRVIVQDGKVIQIETTEKIRL